MLFNSIFRIYRVFKLISIHLPPFILFFLICIFLIDPYIGRYLISTPPEVTFSLEEINDLILAEEKLIKEDITSPIEDDNVVFMFLLGASISAAIGLILIYFNS